MLKTIMKHHNQEPAHAESEYSKKALYGAKVQNIPLRLEHIGAIVCALKRAFICMIN